MNCVETTTGEYGTHADTNFWVPTWERGTYNHHEAPRAFAWSDPDLYSDEIYIQAIPGTRVEGGQALGVMYSDSPDSLPYESVLSIFELNL